MSVCAPPPTTQLISSTSILSVVVASQWKSASGQFLGKDKGADGKARGSEGEAEEGVSTQAGGEADDL